MVGCMSLRLQNKLIGFALEGKKLKKTFPSELLILTSYAVDLILSSCKLKVMVI